jgi:hypothetical protein
VYLFSFLLIDLYFSAGCFELDSIAQCIRQLELLVLGSSQGACHPLWSQMLSHIVVKGNRLPKFVACARSIKAQHLEQFDMDSNQVSELDHLSTGEIHQTDRINDHQAIGIIRLHEV